MAANSGTAEMTYSNVPEDDYPVYNSLTTYGLNARIIVEDDHKIYQSLAASNRGNPVTDATKWIAVGATNRWRLHDASLQSITSYSTVIHNQYRLRGLCTTVAALNLAATSIQVRMYDAIEGLVYDKTISLTKMADIKDWYSYFFSQTITSSPDGIFHDLPQYPNALLDVIITNFAGTASCGILILGQATKVGSTQYGAKVGITDYSLKTQDAFGNYTVTERPYRKTADFQVMVRNDSIDQLQILLAQFRASPVLYLGSDLFSSTAIYGFYRDFDISIAYPEHSLCAINLEGLT